VRQAPAAESERQEGCGARLRRWRRRCRAFIERMPHLRRAAHAARIRDAMRFARQPWLRHLMFAFDSGRAASAIYAERLPCHLF